jgi:hypothetical protein
MVVFTLGFVYRALVPYYRFWHGMGVNTQWYLIRLVPPFLIIRVGWNEVIYNTLMMHDFVLDAGWSVGQANNRMSVVEL